MHIALCPLGAMCVPPTLFLVVVKIVVDLVVLLLLKELSRFSRFVIVKRT